MGNLGLIITIILVVGWIVKGLSSVVGNKDEDGQPRPNRTPIDWDEAQAQRRQARAEQQQALSNMQASAGDPSQMTMAERIELARQRARQQSAVVSQEEAQAQAMRRARARAEQQAQQQRQIAQQQQRAQREQEARRQAARDQERAQQQRRRQAEQKAQTQRGKGSTMQRPAKQARQARQAPAITGSKREEAISKSMQRIHMGHSHDGPGITKLSRDTSNSESSFSTGMLDRASLRKAFIMKELLDKPVALRNPQADLLL